MRRCCWRIAFGGSRGDVMEDHADEATLLLLTPLLRALEMLAFVARPIHTTDFEDLMSSIGAPYEELKSAKRKQAQEPGRLSEISSALDKGCRNAAHEHGLPGGERGGDELHGGIAAGKERGR